MTLGLVILAVVGVVVMLAAQRQPDVALASPAPTSTAGPSPTPQGTPGVLPLPTYVRWAIDKSPDAARPYRVVLIYDGVATNFRILDLAGQVVFRIPIIGSGVFGPETCAVKVRVNGKSEGFTLISVDASTLQQFMNNASTYKVEADTVGATVNLPLSDSGCRSAVYPAAGPVLARGVCTTPGMTTAQLLDKYLDLTTSSDDAAVRDCFARSWLIKHGLPVAWSAAGPRAANDIMSVGPFRNCNYYSVRIDFVNGNPYAGVQSGPFSAFIGIGPEGDRPRIYEMASAMVNLAYENDPGVGVPYCRD